MLTFAIIKFNCGAMLFERVLKFFVLLSLFVSMCTGLTFPFLVRVERSLHVLCTALLFWTVLPGRTAHQKKKRNIGSLCLCLCVCQLPVVFLSLVRDKIWEGFHALCMAFPLWPGLINRWQSTNGNPIDQSVTINQLLSIAIGQSDDYSILNHKLESSNCYRLLPIFLFTLVPCPAD